MEETETTVKDIKLHFDENELNFGIGGRAYQAAYVLNNYLEKHLEQQLGSPLENINALDLGSGTGISALALAALGGNNIIMSDIPDIQELMQHNIARNKHLFKAKNVCNEVLQWGEENTHQCQQLTGKYGGFNLIFGSDIIYFPELYQILVETIHYFYTTLENCLFIISYRFRGFENWEFWEMARDKGLDFELLGDEVLDEQHKDGNYGIFYLKK